MDRKYAQTFARGISVLRFLNEFNGITVKGIAEGTNINRAIVYRLVETLVRDGYVEKSVDDNRYYLTSSVQGLSDGFVGDAWINDIARPVVIDLGHDLIWPVSLATCEGGTMLIRVNSDSDSPLARRRIPTGYRLPILESASGRVYLACCDKVQQKTILNLRIVLENDEQHFLQNRMASTTKQLKAIRRKGYAILHHEGTKVTHVAVPVLSLGIPIATMAIRFFTSAMSTHQGVEKFLSSLQLAANEISEALQPEKTAIK